MLATILNAFQVADIRKKIAFTASMLLIYRLGSHIPVPGVNLTAVNNLQKNFAGSNILSLLNLFSGGGLSRLAIFALGIMPYITASIILQLLQVAVPSLEKLSKEGEVGQARITQYTRYLTVGLAFAQSIGYVFLFRSFEQEAGVSVIPNFNLAKVFLIVISLTAGTVLLMWMGELITQRGIGNGISLLIFASIVARLPDLAFFGELLQRWHRHLQQLQDDRGRDVGHDPQREDRQFRESSAREQVQQAEDVGAPELLLDVVDGAEVDARHRHVGAEAVDQQHRRREADLLPDIGDLEGVEDGGEHACGRSSAPLVSASSRF